MNNFGDKPDIEVSCACIVSGEKVFITQRPLCKQNGGLWEFPGGKLAAGETPWNALKREIAEELCAEIEMITQLPRTSFKTEKISLLLHPFVCRFASSHSLIEPLAARWLPIGPEVPKRLAPADIPIWNALISFLK